MKDNNYKSIFILLITLLLGTACISESMAAEDYPIIFATQIPIPSDFTTITSTFGNHIPDLQKVGRGGDLWIRYTDGSLKNLTLAAGYGNGGFQGSGSIAVRDPAVHWEGNRVIFSMVLDSTIEQYQWETYYWQLYEVTGLAKNETPLITKVKNQPQNYNNISPVYTIDDRIVFSSDRPRKNMSHLYPQLDEYESAEVVSGLWNLEAATGDLFMVTHSPSGDFTPIVDSFGRIIFTRWDHLQRDQQADADVLNATTSTFNWSDEGASAIATNDRSEVFPEPRTERADLLAGTDMRGHFFNHFFPWMVNADGSQLETLNHIGRHDLHGYFDKSLNKDLNLQEFTDVTSGRENQNPIDNFFQIQEDPLRPGYYIGIDAPEFDSHASGQIIELQMPPGMNPDLAHITYRTPRATQIITDSPGADHSGHYRDPLPLSNGQIVAAHTTITGGVENLGSRANPKAKYDFRLKYLNESNGFLVPGSPLTDGISKTVSYWDPDVRVTYSGLLWELYPVELRPHNRPVLAGQGLDYPEISAFDDAGVNLDEFKIWLKNNNLALLVSRNVTTRDVADKQQPFNLKVAASTTQTTGAPGKIYDISHLQFFQGDLIRGVGGVVSPGAGRRVLAQPLHDGVEQNPLSIGGPTGSVKLGTDGSMAILVPAQRALSWQLTDTNGVGVVRERNWLSFAPGEVRVCASCHGINTTDQAGSNTPTNTPQALVDLLKYWSAENNPACVGWIVRYFSRCRFGR
ncbi:MAG: hypothetical protein IMF09_03500 [Proteobacteria bacterium]|nr:hypothetical protein [Pseudomonadota bacterium]